MFAFNIDPQKSILNLTKDLNGVSSQTGNNVKKKQNS